MVKMVASDKSTREPAADPGVDRIWRWLGNVTDPELPQLSIVDLGIVRSIEAGAHEDECTVTITPTYSGCPAVAVIEQRIREELRGHGISKLKLLTRLSPPWTTGWLSPEAREKLRAFGIAPPGPAAPQQPSTGFLVIDIAQAPPIPCPRCDSRNTAPISEFGSTLCKALYRCMDCLEPFELFKRH
jgi:ring-1,2-phenylacetyl-CoA epoxidase subunit PaaD